jgi:hypothetical protein
VGTRGLVLTETDRLSQEDSGDKMNKLQ